MPTSAISFFDKGRELNAVRYLRVHIMTTEMYRYSLDYGRVDAIDLSFLAVSQ